MTDLTALGLPADLPEIAAPTFMGGLDDGVSADLSQQQKAAIIVRVLLSDGRTMSLSQLKRFAFDVNRKGIPKVLFV